MLLVKNKRRAPTNYNSYNSAQWWIALLIIWIYLFLCRSVQILLNVKPVRGGNKVGDRWHIVFLTVLVCCNEMFNLCHLTRWLQHVLKNRLLFYCELVSLCVWRTRVVAGIPAFQRRCHWCTSPPSVSDLPLLFVLSLCTGSLYRVKQLYFMCASPSVVSKVFMCLL